MDEQVRRVLSETKWDRLHRMSRNPRPPSKQARTTSSDAEVTAPRLRSDTADFDEDLRRVARQVGARIPRRQQESLADQLLSPLLSESWNDFLRAAEVRGLADRTLRILEHVSRAFLEAVPDKPLIHLSSVDVDNFIVSSRKKGNSPSTVALKVMWVKTWLNWCTGRGRLGAGDISSPRVILSFDVSTIQKVAVPKRQRRVADLERVSRLLEAIDTDTFDGLRFHTQVLLMLDTGVRAGEVCLMDTTDVSPKADAIKVWGKGSKERMVYPTRDMAERLRQWMAYRARAMESAGLDDSLVLFPSLYGQRQTSMQIGERFRTLSARAKVSPPVNAHSLRHLWTANHRRAGTDPFTLRQLGGWSDMGIVMAYVGELASEDAARANQSASAVKDLVGTRVPRRQAARRK